MNVTNPSTIEDYILTTLQRGAMPIVELIRVIKEKRVGTTKQGVYLVIRKLKKQEIVVVNKKNINLNSVWLKTIEEFFTKAKYNIRNEISYGNDLLNLKNGEKLQYYFRSPILMDVFWSHAFLTLLVPSSIQLPILIYHPHEWFLLARTKNETDVFDMVSKRGQKLAVLVGHNTPLDLSVKKYFEGTKEYEVSPTPIFSKPNYYVNVIGDFVIEVWLNEKVASQIDNFYNDNSEFGDKQKEELERILMQNGKNKFSISHNKRKADDIRRKFKKFFFLN